MIALGPLTNIANALQLYPDLAHSVAEIVIMGGVFNHPNYLKDTNFAIDPEAAYRVLNSGAKITLAPLDATTTTLMTQADLDRLATLTHPLNRFITQTTQPWLTYSSKTRHLNGCWLHDVVCIAQLIEPLLVKKAAYCVDIALNGAHVRGSCRRWKKAAIRLTVGLAADPTHEINVIEQVNNEQLIELIWQTLAHYDDKPE